MSDYFFHNLTFLEEALSSIHVAEFERMISEADGALKRGNKIVVSGLGKNVPICDKFVGTMVSLGMDASFLHTNSALHGDLGIVKDGDFVLLLSKSGSTQESIALAEELQKRTVCLWLMTFQEKGLLCGQIKNKILIHLAHEGDLWNIVPNNSSVLNLIVLQTLAMELAKKRDIPREVFQKNHPGGAIGEKLKRWNLE